ncbi:MAG: hypothetical protein KR126chlam3_00196 [Chlamydiae bacterium]|nr:hypothetical protein [Chlamydiota bacterium]
MKKLIFLTLSLTSFFLCDGLEAVPSFSKNLGLDCSACHTAYPQLTEFGKIFLESAGEILVQEKYGMLSMTPNPLSARINLRPIDKKFSTDSKTELTKKDRLLKLRAFHEIEVFLAGRVGKVFYLVEFEAEDEWGDKDRNGFDVRFTEGYAVYQLNENFNIFTGFASPFVLDGNDTVHHHKVLRRQWKAAEYVPETSQMLGINGKYRNFNCIAAWHADFEELEGQDPKNLSLRAFYNYGLQTFGAYFSHGKHFDEASSRSKFPFYLYGVDAHLRFKNTNIMVLLGFRDEHDKKRDFDFSIEANSIFAIQNTSIKKYLTSIIPIANLDVFIDREKSSGIWLQGSTGVAFYINPSVRFFPMIEGTLVSPSEYKHKDFRVLLTLDIGL